MTCLLGLAALVWSCRGLEMPPSSAENQAPEWMPEGGYNWVKAEDVETRELFRRNYGLGYSYNAVRGDYCNWKDIRQGILRGLGVQLFLPGLCSQRGRRNQTED